jgi:glycine cleavage system transcriptional repressor
MIILTAVGPDRPGMAHALSRILADAGCNIEDTTMTRLAGEFAMILIVTPPANLSLADFQARLAPLETSHDLWINVRDIPDEAPMEEKEAPRFIVSAYGADQAGLLSGMTGVFAEHNVNITDVQTRVASHGAVYVMLFEVVVPTALDENTLRAALTKKAGELGVSVSLRPLEEASL